MFFPNNHICYGTFPKFTYETFSKKFNIKNHVDTGIASSLYCALSIEFIYFKYERNGCTFPLPLPDF